jgi:hypothetical protein
MAQLEHETRTAMSTPDQAAKLREIKRLLDRIQQLPHIAAAAAGNGARNGLAAGAIHARAADADESEEADYREEPPYAGYSPYSPAPASGNGAHNGIHADTSEEEEPGTAPVNGAARGGLYAQAPFSSPSEADRVPPVLPVPPPLPAHALTSLSLREQRQAAGSRALVPVQTSSAVGISPWVFVTATAVNTIIAAVLAVVITLGVGRRGPAEVAPAAMAGKEAAGATAQPIELVHVGSRKEPLRLEAMQPARFPLQVRPEEAMQASYILVVAGLPANATLFGATRMSSDSWLVAPGALRQLEIVVPEWSPSVIELKVELRHANGAVATEGKAWLAVPPPPVPRGKPDRAALKEMLRRGDRLLGQGDVAAARAVYEQAAALGSPRAALLLGSTYDPGRLWSLGVFGMVGDKERARHWYLRAEQFGHPEAKERLRGLR